MLAPHLADGGQLGEQHLEHWRRQGLLQDLEQLLGLAAHCDGIGQVIYPLLIVTWGLVQKPLIKRTQFSFKDSTYTPITLCIKILQDVRWPLLNFDLLLA